MSDTKTVQAPKPLIPGRPKTWVKPLTEKECIAKGLPSTSKAKPRLGIPEDHEVIWACVGVPLDDHQNLQALSRKYEVPLSEMLARVVCQWVEDNRSTIYSEAEAHIKAELSDDDLQAKIDAQLRALKRTQELLAARKQPAQ